MAKSCTSTLPSVAQVPSSILNCFRVFNFIIWPLNILGNAFLIYALRKTGQTNTVSFKFIIIMSISDLIYGITGLFSVSLLFWKHFDSNCYLQSGAEWILNTQGSFSMMMIALIALDRYLHLSYLSRYQSIMNTMRGYCMALTSLFFCAIMATMYQILLNYNKETATMLLSIGVFFGILTLGGILVLYCKAYKSLQRKAPKQTNQVARSILHGSRRFLKTAKLIVISAVLLTMPKMLAMMFDFINLRKSFMNEISLDAFRWFAILIYSVNAFSSSTIFIMHNRVVKQLLKSIITLNRVHSNAANGE